MHVNNLKCLGEIDAIVLRTLEDPYILGYDKYSSLWWLKFTPLNIMRMIYVPQQTRAENSSGRDGVNQAISDILATPHKILLFPEGGLTNGNVGLLQYHKYTFGLDEVIQPITLQYSCPLCVNLDEAYKTFVGNILWFVFVPYKKYTVTFLSPQKINQFHVSSANINANGNICSSKVGVDIGTDIENEVSKDNNAETPLQFCRRVMKLTSTYLHTQCTPFLYKDKRIWLSLKKIYISKGYDIKFIVDSKNENVDVIDRNNSISSTELKNMLLIDMDHYWGMNATTFHHLIFEPNFPNP